MSILKKLRSLAPALSAVVVAACIGVSLHGYSTPVYAVDIPETTKNQTDEDASEQENADTAEKEKKEDKKKDEDKKEEQKSTAKGSFDVSDGTYYGTGTGFAGKIKVAVTVKDKQITAIEIVENEADDDTFFSRAKGVIDKIISGQTLDVDVVSGATYSSNGIISAVKNALTGAADSGTPASTSAGASGGSSSPAGGSSSVSTVQDASAYADGTYYGTGTGFSGALTVEVVISGGKISSIQIMDTSDGDSYIQSASGLISNIIATQSTNVDTVSGATYSSVGIIEAVRNALSQAAISSDGNSNSQNTNSSSNGNGQNSNNNSSDNTTAVTGKFPYKEGVYYGTAEGYLDDIKVAIVIQDKTLKAVVIIEENDDETFFKRARTVAENMVKKQTVDVDVVSGATYSSKGIIGAVKEALKEAEKATKGENDNSNNNNNNNNSNNNNGNNSNNNGNNNNNGNDNNGNDNNGGNNGDNENPDETKYIYADGEYTVIVPCLPNEDGDFEAYSLTMKVTISKDKITDISEIKGDGSSDNDAYIKRAVQGTSKLPGVVTQILEKGTLEEIDTVSRATCSSNSILEGCNLALETAKKVQSGEDTGEDSGQDDSNQNTEENAGDETP
ncbi:fMN-binding domain protein [Firmicutes bacterium CAG:227]|nr:fMN-binding domain protein [Firmicutes bacterium CAG:227]